MNGLATVREFADVTDASLALGHRTYSGTVSTTERSAGPVASYSDVTAASLALGHRTYSGTVSSTERMP